MSRPDGSDEQALLEGDLDEMVLAWFSDGRRFLAILSGQQRSRVLQEIDRELGPIKTLGGGEFSGRTIDIFLYVLWTNDEQARESHGGVYLASLSGGEKPVRIVPDASSVAYASPGYLLVVRDGNLIATPFDTRTKRVAGEAIVIATGVLYDRSNATGAFSASNDGTLVYVSGEAFLDATMHWYDRAGNETAASLAPAAYESLRLAPDATRAAAAITGASGDNEIWVLDLARGVSTRLASASWTYDYPVWSAESDRVMYGSQQVAGVDFYTRFADGSGVEQPVMVDGSERSCTTGRVTESTSCTGRSAPAPVRWTSGSTRWRDNRRKS